MTPIVFLAVLLAALLHATWNALVKGGADKYASMLAITLGHVPPALLLLPFVAVPGPAVWPYLAAGVALHVGYQLFLVAAYRLGDLTHVYPIARGSAPAIIAAVSLALGLTMTRHEWIAVGMIVAGILSLAIVRGGDGRRNPRAAAAALATGAFIAAYSLVDGWGARVADSALSYWCWAALGNAVAFVAVTLPVRPDAPRLVLREAGLRRLAIVGGGASFAAYALVTWAFTLAPIALVSALRETSIVFALLIGVGFMGERLSLMKVLSTLVTIAGAAMLRLAR